MYSKYCGTTQHEVLKDKLGEICVRPILWTLKTFFVKNQRTSKLTERYTVVMSRTLDTVKA